MTQGDETQLPEKTPLILKGKFQSNQMVEEESTQWMPCIHPDSSRAIMKLDTVLLIKGWNKNSY